MKYLKSFLLSTSHMSRSTVLSRFHYSSLIPEDLSINFRKSLPNIIGKVTSGRKYLNIPGFADKIQKATEYNTRCGNNIGSITLLHAYRMLGNYETITAESLQQAFVLAWAVEMVHSYNLMMEQTRIPDLGATSVIDAELLRGFLHFMLEDHFNASPRYEDFLKLYNKAFVYSALARDIEFKISAKNNKYNEFTEKQYDLLCEYKTAYQSFALPFSLAMKLANVNDENLCARVGKICFEMGKLYQMKKDYDSCFGRGKMITTSGTDIQQDKCTWLAVSALQRFTPRQRLVFAACYGGDGPAYVERIKLLYQQVEIPQLYKERQSAMSEEIRKMAEEFEKEGVSSTAFLEILNEILRDEVPEDDDDDDW